MTTHTLRLVTHTSAPRNFTSATTESHDPVDAPWLLGACLLVFGYMAAAIALVLTG